MARSFKRLVKDQDMFGYPISLHFNKHGPVHKTVCGGTFSLMTMLIAFIIIIVKLTETSDTMSISEQRFAISQDDLKNSVNLKENSLNLLLASFNLFNTMYLPKIPAGFLNCLER